MYSQQKKEDHSDKERIKAEELQKSIEKDEAKSLVVIVNCNFDALVTPSGSRKNVYLLAFRCEVVDFTAACRCFRFYSPSGLSALVQPAVSVSVVH